MKRIKGKTMTLSRLHIATFSVIAGLSASVACPVYAQENETSAQITSEIPSAQKSDAVAEDAGNTLTPKNESGLEAPQESEEEVTTEATGEEAAPTEEEYSKSADDHFREALIATYSSNPRIISQRMAFEQIGERFNQALAGWLPTLNATYNKGRRRNRFDGGEWNYLDSQTRRFDISQPVFDISVFHALSQADNTIASSGAELINTTQDILLNAITSYLDVVRDRQILDLSRNNEVVLDKNLGATRERFDVGEATKTDVSQSEARVSRAESETIQAIGNEAIAVAAFERVTGYAPHLQLAYPTELPAIPSKLDEAIDLAMKLNPRILSAKYNEAAADDAVGVNKSDLLPTARLQGSVSREEGLGFTAAPIDSDAVLLNVNIPLYQGGAEYSRIRESKKERSRRRYDLLETTNEVRQQTISAWEQYQTALAAIEAQKDTIRAAEVALDGVQQEQLYGSRTVLDVLDAEQELFVARVNLERSERNRLVALYNLLSVVGQLSPSNLQLDIAEYDQEEKIDEIKYQFIGF
jgi:outer membrane protein